MALEDAVVFGTLFSHLTSITQIPVFLSAYEELRIARTVKVKSNDVSDAIFARMPSGTIRDVWNKFVRHARDDWNNEILRSEFDSLAMLFGYDAYDAAEVYLTHFGNS
jgi:salicylate hydroxylase